MTPSAALSLFIAFQDPATTTPAATEPAATRPEVTDPWAANPEAGPEAPDLDASTCIHDPPACVKIAGGHFDAGRFADAVPLFEALATAHPKTAKYHYFAGLAREGAGDDTAAYIHMRRFLVNNTGNAADRKRATRRTTTILSRTTRVSLRTPKSATPLTLRLKRTGATHTAEPAIIIPLAILPARGDVTELALTPGGWEFTLDPARIGEMEVAPLRIEVPASTPSLDLELAASPIRYKLTLELGPTRALDRGITLSLRRTSGLSLTVAPDATSVHRELPPGTWTYEASARGFLPQKHTFELDRPLVLPIKLTPKWNDERRKRLGLGLGLAGAGLATGIAGGVLLGLSESRMPDTVEKATPNAPSGNLIEFRRLRTIGDLGSASLGAVVGLWAGALVQGISRRPEHAWKITLALGLLSAAGGSFAYAMITKHWESLDDEEKLDPLGQRYQPSTASSSIGLGLGLIGSSIAIASQYRPLRLRRAAALRAQKKLSLRQ